MPMAHGVVVAQDASSICEGLFASGLVLQGAPGYEYARYARGFLVAGRTSSNKRAWILSAIGGEVSNDHHPVYEIQFADGGALTRSHVYFEDIAGIEGARWYVVSAVVFIAGALLFTATLGIVLSARFVARRLTRFAADSGWRHN